MSVDDAFDADVAVVGMAGRFPGARDVDAFWKNLREGVESIRPCSEGELQRAGVRGITRADPLFVNAGAVMDDPECFDAEFFGFARREAETMDPQHRVMLECAWATLEDAGYPPTEYPGVGGVFGGVAH